VTERLYARLCENVNLHIRRGAWYRVLKLEELPATLEVNRHPVPVAKALLEFAKRPPAQWTVVQQRASWVAAPPAGFSGVYAVCPSCTERAPLPARTKRMTCPACKWEFPVAWNEHYLRQA
jgi:hypothetical protein